MIYGYCRISTKEQSIERQVRNIKKEFPDAIILKEIFTGTKSDRPEWSKLQRKIQPGDTIIFDSVSRMSRTADEGVETYMELFQKGVDLVFLKERTINTQAYTEARKSQVKETGTDVDLILKGVNEYLMKLAEDQIRRAFEQSEKEVQDLRQRTKEGMVTAALNGKQIGRRVGTRIETEKAVKSKKKIRQHAKEFGGNLSDAELIRMLGISPNSYYKYKRELKAVDGRLAGQMELVEEA